MKSYGFFSGHIQTSVFCRPELVLGFFSQTPITHMVKSLLYSIFSHFLLSYCFLLFSSYFIKKNLLFASSMTLSFVFCIHHVLLLADSSFLK